MRELLEQARAAVEGGDGLTPVSAAVMPVAGTLATAIGAAARTGRPVFVQVDDLPVTVFPAGTKPTRQVLVTNVQPEARS